MSYERKAKYETRFEKGDKVLTYVHQGAIYHLSLQQLVRDAEKEFPLTTSDRLEITINDKGEIVLRGPK